MNCPAAAAKISEAQGFKLPVHFSPEDWQRALVMFSICADALVIPPWLQFRQNPAVLLRNE